MKWEPFYKLFFKVSLSCLASACSGIQPAFAEGIVAELKRRPIPPTGKLSELTALSYHTIAINTEDPRYKEPLVAIKKFNIAQEPFYARKDGLNAPYYSCICPGEKSVRLRLELARKLNQINSRLCESDLELFVFDGYRPIECQQKLWQYFLEEAARQLGKSAGQKALIEYAGKYCSNPSNYSPANWQSWPVHITGGAVDLTVRRKSTGELLYMGGIFDDASELSASDYFEKQQSKQQTEKMRPEENAESASRKEARENRRLLYWLMSEEGFANYPNEWWHYDYGTQMWAKNRRNFDGAASSTERPETTGKEAFYGRI